MTRILQTFEQLARTIYEWHQRAQLVGHHDFYHAVRVAVMAERIAPNPVIGQLAAIAGICHNADRLLQKEFKLNRQEVPRAAVQALLQEWLVNTELSGIARDQVVIAVLNHDQKNTPKDGLVQVTLMDADRIVNVQADVIMRAGQLFPDLPAVDPVYGLVDTQATFREPRSVLRDLSHNLEWGDTRSPYCLRLPKAWEIGKPYFDYLRQYIMLVQRQLHEAGLDPEGLPSWLKR